MVCQISVFLCLYHIQVVLQVLGDFVVSLELLKKLLLHGGFHDILPRILLWRHANDLLILKNVRMLLSRQVPSLIRIFLQHLFARVYIQTVFHFSTGLQI